MLSHKITRYKNIISTLNNWPGYLFKKAIGFGESFTFDVKNFGAIEVPKNMFGPFRENFFDNIYFKHIPQLSTAENAPVIIDIGTNVGFFSLAAFARYPRAQIFGFEPHPFTASVFCKTIKSSTAASILNIYNKAVSDKEEEIPIYTSTVNGFATMSSINSIKNEQKVFKAKTLRLDDFLEEQKIDKIDLIKLDCEGSEYPILYSISESVFKIINNLSIETHKGEQEGHDLHSLNRYLQKLGYTTKVLDAGNYAGYIWAWR